ncbi:hypothetical protein [Streptomyces sp. NPDC087859]|uniref:hypothetical protein n=1 Tax=Streptomyces sp. NPDC087859 TaxID=3365812 RepID=UPI003829A488
MGAVPAGPQGVRIRSGRRCLPLHPCRAAVVAAGRTEFDSILQDPSVFTPYARDLIWAEPLLYTPDRAYQRITGKEWDRGTRYSYESCSNTEGWAD